MAPAPAFFYVDSLRYWLLFGWFLCCFITLARINKTNGGNRSTNSWWWLHLIIVSVHRGFIVSLFHFQGELKDCGTFIRHHSGPTQSIINCNNRHQFQCCHRRNQIDWSRLIWNMHSANQPLHLNFMVINDVNSYMFHYWPIDRLLIDSSPALLSFRLVGNLTNWSELIWISRVTHRHIDSAWFWTWLNTNACIFQYWNYESCLIDQLRRCFVIKSINQG